MDFSDAPGTQSVVNRCPARHGTMVSPPIPEYPIRRAARVETASARTIITMTITAVIVVV
jgi:hypothetical protein